MHRLIKHCPILIGNQIIKKSGITLALLSIDIKTSLPSSMEHTPITDTSPSITEEKILIAEGVDMENRPVLGWSDVKQIMEKGTLERLGRSNIQLTEYREFRSQLLINWVSVTDYVMVSKLDFKCITLENGKKTAEIPAVIQTRTVLTKNDFPYNFESGIEHYVLWKIGSDINSVEIAAAALNLSVAIKAVDYVTYVNPPHLKSILDLDHAHILLKVET